MWMAWEVATFIGKCFKAGLGQGFGNVRAFTAQLATRNPHPATCLTDPAHAAGFYLTGRRGQRLFGALIFALEK